MGGPYEYDRALLWYVERASGSYFTKEYLGDDTPEHQGRVVCEIRVIKGQHLVGPRAVMLQRRKLRSTKEHRKRKEVSSSRRLSPSVSPLGAAGHVNPNFMLKDADAPEKGRLL